MSVRRLYNAYPMGALALLVHLCLVDLAICSSNFTDQLALLNFKSSIKNDPNNVLSNWTKETNFCGWAGVICSRHRQRVTSLHLHNMGLEGTISPHVEYGSEGRVTTNGDIYSYGVMLLETFKRKKPTDEMFSAKINLRQWLSASLPNKIMEIVDGGLLRMQNGSDMVTSQSILLAILELGLECTSDIPMEMSDIKKVLVKLNKIRKKLLHIQSI